MALGIVSHVKGLRAAFNRLPSEAKMSYTVASVALLFVLYLSITFFIPDEEQPLSTADSQSDYSISANRNGTSNFSDSDVGELPVGLAMDISQQRKDTRQNSDIVFDRYDDIDAEIASRNEALVQDISTKINATVVVDEMPAQTPSDIEPIVLVDETPIEQPVEQQREMPNERFLGSLPIKREPVIRDDVDDDEMERSFTVSEIEALLNDPEMAKLWTSEMNRNFELKRPAPQPIGQRVIFFSDESESTSSLDVLRSGRDDDATGVNQGNDDAENYSGDDFLPGRIFLGRIQGIVESDTQTPFVRIVPVEGPEDWVNDTVFLAQPRLVEGQGFEIRIEKVTHGSNSGSFQAVAVTTDKRRSSLIVDDIESREFQRLLYLVSGGVLTGLNNFASRLGETVYAGDQVVGQSVEFNEKNVAISAIGGVGSRGEQYLYSKVANTKDNYMLMQDKLIGIMMLSKPDLEWLPDLDNKIVY